MHRQRYGVIGAALLLAVGGCAQAPMGPTVQVMPAAGKSFAAFQADQTECKGYAADQVQGQAEAANKQAVGAAVLTTLIGAGVGAAAGGGFSNSLGAGAGLGAAAGSLLGGGLGAVGTPGAQQRIQGRYNMAYAQCMYAKGDQVPGVPPQAAAPAAAAVPAPAVAQTPVGSDPALVRAVQSELARLDYLHGPADGVMGPATGAAIAAFERGHGMVVDGAPSRLLLARLESTAGTSRVAATAAAAPPPPPPAWVTPAAAPAAWVAPSVTP